jgi:hypothetical protein
MGNLTRRRFVTVGVSFVPAAAAMTDNVRKHVFVSESRTTQAGTVAIVGFLFATNSDPDPQRWRTVRQSLQYQRVLRYRGTDRDKRPFVNEVLRYYVAASGLTFTAVVLTIDPKASGRDRQQLIARAYPQILRAAGVSGGMTLYVKGRPSEVDQRVKATAAAKMVCTWVRVTRRDKLLMGMANILAGTTACEFNNDPPGSVGRYFKEALSSSLKRPTLRLSVGTKWVVKSLSVA